MATQLEQLKRRHQLGNHFKNYTSESVYMLLIHTKAIRSSCALGLYFNCVTAAYINIATHLFDTDPQCQSASVDVVTLHLSHCHFRESFANEFRNFLLSTSSSLDIPNKWEVSLVKLVSFSFSFILNSLTRIWRLLISRSSKTRWVGPMDLTHTRRRPNNYN